MVKPKKLPWTAEEDRLLRKVVKEYQSDNLKPDGTFALSATWGEIAELVPKRTAKQCRERWCYNLSPAIKRDIWTVEEDALLLKVQTTLGNQWALIARHLKGRTENSVKTRYKSIMRALKRSWRKSEDELILQYQRKYGSSRWGDIAEKLPGRTANGVKARYSLLRKGLANEVPEKGSPLQILYQQDVVDNMEFDDDVLNLSRVAPQPKNTVGRKRSWDEAKPSRMAGLLDAIEKNLADPEHMKSIGLDWKVPYTKRTKLEPMSATGASVKQKKLRTSDEGSSYISKSGSKHAATSSGVVSNPVDTIIQDESVPATIRATILAQSQQLLLYSQAIQTMVSQQYQNMVNANVLSENLNNRTENLVLGILGQHQPGADLSIVPQFAKNVDLAKTLSSMNRLATPVTPSNFSVPRGGT